jgi:hypothetical protein
VGSFESSATTAVPAAGLVGLLGYATSAGDLGDRGDISTDGARVDRPLGDDTSFQSLLGRSTRGDSNVEDEVGQYFG